MNYLILALSLMSFTSYHIGHMAEYKYELNEQELTLRFEIEKAELLSYQISQDCDVRKMTALCTAKYLNQHTLLEINGKKVDFELQQSFTIDDHLIVLMEAKIEDIAIKDLSIENTCFLDFNPIFKNRIIVQMNQYQKSYLLDSKRNSIHLE